MKNGRTNVSHSPLHIRFGLDTFVPKRPYYDIKPREVPDYAKIEEAARLYAKTKELATQNVDTKSAGEK